jgi:hypothetical protein
LTIDSMRWRIQPIGGLGRLGSSLRLGLSQQRAQLADGGFEVGAGEALVADDRGALDRVGFQQRERRFALALVGGDQVEVEDRAVRSAEQQQFEAPVAARVGRAVAEAGPGRELAAAGRLERLATGKRRRVEEPQVVARAERLGSECLPEQHQLRRQRPAALVVARLRREIGKEVTEPAAGAITRALQQHLGDHQRQQLVVANQLRAAAARRPLGRNNAQAAQ